MGWAGKAGAETINYEESSPLEVLKEITGGRGPDACIDAVGLEAHTPGVLYAYDRLKQAVMAESDRPIALREAIMACRSGQCHVQRYMRPLLDRIQKGEIDPSFVITHHLSLEEPPKAFAMFNDKQDSVMKIVLKPNGMASA